MNECDHICYWCGDGGVLAPLCWHCGKAFRCSECDAGAGRSQLVVEIMEEHRLVELWITTRSGDAENQVWCGSPRCRSQFVDFPAWVAHLADLLGPITPGVNDARI